MGIQGRRYVTVAQAFGARGYVYSICRPDWTPAMRSIAEIIAKGISRICYPEPLDWRLLPRGDRDSLGCQDCGQSDCDIMVEIGEELMNEECPEELYARLTAAERHQYLKRKQVDIETKAGVVNRKTILCPLPKLPAPRDCDTADPFVRELWYEYVVAWYYCEKSGENFNDACDDGIDNDSEVGIDCEDPKCGDCEVCEGTGCEPGCRYGVELTERAKEITRGHFVRTRCDPLPNNDPDC